MISTVPDLLRFYRALLRGRLLLAPLLRQMTRTVRYEKPDVPQLVGYGLGLQQWRFSCGTFLGHAGSLGGYMTWTFNDSSAKRQLAFAYSFPPQPARLLPKLAARVFSLTEAALCHTDQRSVSASRPASARKAPPNDRRIQTITAGREMRRVRTPAAKTP
jgi:D-alanyl-D-alanine carboxypeptidase